jgi:hypothetical protein
VLSDVFNCLVAMYSVHYATKQMKVLIKVIVSSVIC